MTLPLNPLLFARYARMAARGLWYRITGAKTVPLGPVQVLVDHPALSPRMRFNLRIGHYEEHEQVLLTQLLRPSDRMLEIGAGVGFLSLLAATRIGGDQILAVEANPKLIDLIERNQQLNQSPFRVMNAVLGAGETQRDFYLAENFWASGLAPAPNTERITVKQRDFQTVLRDFQPSVLVIDIEGGEAELLRDAQLDTVNTVLLELHPQVLSGRAIGGIFQSLADNGLYPDLLRSMGYVYVFQRDAPDTGKE